MGHQPGLGLVKGARRKVQGTGRGEVVKVVEIVDVVYLRGQKSDVGDQLVLFLLNSLYFGV